MGKGWLNPRLLLFKSVVVYIFLSFTEGKLLYEQGQCTVHVWGDGSKDGKHITQNIFNKVILQNGNLTSEFSQGEK